MIRILYIDDEVELLNFWKLLLEKGGEFSVEIHNSAKEALRLLKSGKYDIIISDYQMPRMDGIEFLRSVGGSGNKIPFILFTGRGREEIVIQALNEGADFYLQKGGEPESLLAELSHKIKIAVQKREAEIALKTSEEQYRVLIEHIQDGVFVSQDSILIFCNEALASMVGYTSKDIIGTDVALLIAEEERDLVIGRQKDRLAGKILPESYEFNLLHKDGTTRIPVILSAGTSILREKPAVIGTLHSLVQERMREAALRRSEKKYRDIYNNAYIGLFASTPEGRFISANPQAVKNLGYDSEEDLINSVTDIREQIYVDHSARDEIFNLLTTKGFVNDYEARFYRKDGSIIWGSISARVTVDENENIIIEGTSLDINARKLAEIALLERVQ